MRFSFDREKPLSGIDQDAYKPPLSDLAPGPASGTESEQTDAGLERLKGLRGWLILVGFGVVISPFRIGYQFLYLYLPILTGGGWSALTDPRSPSYLPHYGLLLGVEMAANLGLLLAFCTLIYLFFSKHYLFPRMYTLTVCAGFLFVLIDAAVVKWLYLPDQPWLDAHTLRELLPTAISILIWVPYLHLSKRARLTFVEKRPADSIRD